MAILAQYSEHISDVISRLGDPGFPRALVAMMRTLVPFEDATILRYPDVAMPVIEYYETPPGSSSSTLDVFVKGAFLLDPFYRAATRDREFGVFRLRDLAPSGFQDSEYYRGWYRNCGYQDECGYLIATGDTGFVNIALGRISEEARFTISELATLRAVLPAIEALCRQHWSDSEESPASVDLRARLNSALDCFGSSVLTDREAQVINLVLHGHSTRTLAERLSISMETVKLHRKHAYAKLEVSSQAELFYLFLDSVMSAEAYSEGDPLVPYMQPPGA